MVALAIKQGWLRHKIRGWYLVVAQLGRVWARRRMVQRESSLPTATGCACSPISSGHSACAVARRAEGVLNGLMRVYWRVARRLV